MKCVLIIVCVQVLDRGELLLQFWSVEVLGALREEEEEMGLS